MTGPSIKATTFQAIADELRASIEAGKLSREVLEARLEARDLVYVDDEKLAPTAWIPIDTYDRAVELLADLHSRGHREDYLISRGAQAAKRLSSLGIYSQLDATTENMGPRVGTMIITVSQVLFNFGRWRYEAGTDGGFSIEISEAAAMPDVGRYAIQGFAEYVATRASGYPMRVRSERPRPDLLLYRAERAA